MDAFLTCRECNKVVTRDTKFCPYCGTENPSKALVTLASSEPSPFSSSTIPLMTMHVEAPEIKVPTFGKASIRVQKRYRDAYRAVKWDLFLGHGLKVVGVVLAFVGVAASNELAGNGYNSNDIILASGIAVSLVVCVCFFVVGVMICSQAQLRQATLDSAVYQSPFLDDDQRLEAMGIRSHKPQSL